MSPNTLCRGGPPWEDPCASGGLDGVPTNPYIFVTDGSVTGIAGSGGNLSYCTRPDTEASRYRLDTPISQGAIVMIDFTRDGLTVPAYCIQKGVRAPQGIPYQSMPFDAVLPGNTREQQEMVGWIMANTYPVVTSAATFDMVGVDWRAAPMLDDNDAYAAVSAAIWNVLGQTTIDEIRFINCVGGGLHPKSERLRTTALGLIAMAFAFVQQPDDPARPETACARHCGAGYCVSCCADDACGHGQSPHLRISCCPRQICMICGCLLIGPFTVLSGLDGPLEIKACPTCVGSEGFCVNFADGRGNLIDPPQANEEFFLLVRALPCSFCFTLTATIRGTVVRIAFLEESAAVETLQKISVSEKRLELFAKASLCILVEKECEPCPPCPPCPPQRCCEPKVCHPPCPPPCPPRGFKKKKPCPPRGGCSHGKKGRKSSPKDW